MTFTAGTSPDQGLTGGGSAPRADWGESFTRRTSVHCNLQGCLFLGVRAPGTQRLWTSRSVMCRLSLLYVLSNGYGSAVGGVASRERPGRPSQRLAAGRGPAMWSRGPSGGMPQAPFGSFEETPQLAKQCVVSHVGVVDLRRKQKLIEHQFALTRWRVGRGNSVQVESQRPKAIACHTHHHRSNRDLASNQIQLAPSH